jgi:hypothetical protein
MKLIMFALFDFRGIIGKQSTHCNFGDKTVWICEKRMSWLRK